MRRLKPKLIFIPFHDDKNPTDDANSKALATMPSTSAMSILSSCNGLLCCSSYCRGNYQLHIANPTTKQIISLPQPHDGLKGVSLAFDPSRSHHYKVVCVWGTISILSTKPYQSECHYQIEIYSSETGSWRASGDPFTSDHNAQFLGGVYWNGAIHWFNKRGNSMYFNIEEERLGIIPMPPIPPGDWCGRPLRYYGESRGHLHLVEIYGTRTQFSVYEMERDYSGWFVKYRVDLDAVGIAFPGMMQRLLLDPMCYSFSILTLVPGEEDEGSFLVVHIPGKVIRYNLVDKSFKRLCDVAPEQCDSNGMILDTFGYFWFHAFEYIETLSYI